MKSEPKNLPLILAFVLLSALFLLLSQSTRVAVEAAFLVLLMLFKIPRLNVDKIGQLVFGLVMLGLAAGVEVLFFSKNEVSSPNLIGPLGRAAALGFSAVAITRLSIIQNPWGKDPVTAGFGFLALLSMGSVQEGAAYPVLSAPILVLLILGAGGRDPAQKLSRPAARARRRGTLLLLGAAATIFFALIVSLPILYNAAFGLIENALADTRTGFGFGMALGDLDDMMRSEETVMRIRGKRTDYLRGAVYTRYARGRWRSPVSKGARPLSLRKNEAPFADETEIRFTGGDRHRFFLPLFASVRAASPGLVLAEQNDLFFPAENDKTDFVQFTVKPQKQDTSFFQTPDLLLLPDSEADALKKIARDWTRASTDERSKLSALSDRLRRDFRYSLNVSMPKGKDPIVSFLTQQKKGSCEYFASAMALLARAAGIPSRVVGGYRVREYNPLGGYRIVREKNAHAWVEAHVAGTGWITVDPTPSDGEVGPERTPFIAALLDTAADKLRSLGDFISRRTPGQIALFTFALLFIWILVRVSRAFLKKQKRRSKTHSLEAYLPPPQCVPRLLNALSKAGFPRTPDEPVERFAKRILETAPKGSAQTSAAKLLLCYAGIRFGNRGDLSLIEKDIIKAIPLLRK